MTALDDILKHFNFQQYENKEYLLYLDYENKQNCMGRFFIRKLNDGSFRLSITQHEGDDFDEIDLFEFRTSDKPIAFISSVVNLTSL